MAGRGLSERLVSSGALRREAVQMARRRQQVYGGGLDTVLLEMGLVDEGTLWALLVEDAELPPLPPSFLDRPIVEPTLLFEPALARRLGVFVFEPAQGTSDDLQAVARPNFDKEGVDVALGSRKAEFFVVPEVRFEALLGSFYAQAIPPRFVSLLGRLMGADQLRRWSALRAPRPRLPTPPVDVGPRYLPVPEVPPAAAEETFQQPTLEPVLEAPTQPLPSPPLPTARTTEQVPLQIFDALPREKSERDDLYSALAWLADLQGGPRASAVSEAICGRWSATEIFSRLVPLARRGENVAAAALPLLAQVQNIEFLEQQLTTGSTRDRVWAALALGICLQQAELRQLSQLGTETSLFASDPVAAARITQRLCERVERDPEPDMRAAAARGLRGFSTRKEVNALIKRLALLVADPSALDPSRAGAAIVLGEMRSDTEEGVQGLIQGTGAKNESVAGTCHAALVRITGHDPGRGRARWRKWWKQYGTLSRAAWLVSALESRRPEVRLAASNELAELTGMSFGFHFDLTPGHRKVAVERWKHWLAAPPA